MLIAAIFYLHLYHVLLRSPGRGNIPLHAFFLLKIQDYQSRQHRPRPLSLGLVPDEQRIACIKSLPSPEDEFIRVNSSPKITGKRAGRVRSEALADFSD